MQKYNKEMLDEAAKNSVTISGMLKYLNLSLGSSNHRYLKYNILKFDVDISHFTGRSSGLGGKKTLHNDIFDPEKSRRSISGTSLRAALIKNGVEYKCSRCGINEWQGENLVLDVDHIDGDPFNNLFHNLRFLCPNCHRLTPTFCNNRKRKGSDVVKPEFYSYICKDCLGVCRTKNKPYNNGICFKCSLVYKRKPRPSIDDLILDIESMGYVRTGIKYGVSDNAIRKWVVAYGLSTKEIKRVYKDNMM